MSRVGKLPIVVPQGVRINLQGAVLQVEGPKGKMQHAIPEGLKIDVTDNSITVTRLSEQNKIRALHGLTRSLVANMVSGVTQGYKKELEIVGVGYRADMSNNMLNLTLGYSHPINFPLPEGIKGKVEKQVITIEGIDKGLVGQIAAKIKSLRKPDVYKGKGIRYLGEVIKTKVGKSGAK
ncbi:MAG: 50S ribosomal protein L6 [Proteobacteria bacterium]|nr:50S ribosomal protein L6 [Pseudomonadota bacterium]